MAALIYETTLSYSLTSPARQLTITPTGATWRVWVNGTLYTFTGAQTISHAATQGLWYIYVDNTGTITASQTFWNILDVAPIALIYYDATTPDYWLFDERHHYDTPVEWHQSQHFAIGTFIKNLATDFVIGGYTLNTDTDAAVQWSMTSGTAVDEDIENLCNAISSGGPYQVMHRSGASGYFLRNQTTLPYIYAPGSYIYWNQFTGGSWALTAMTSSQRVNYYIFATTGYDGTKQLMLIPGQAQYGSLAAAQAESVTSLNLTGFPALEFVPLYQVTFHTLAGYSHNGKCEIEAVTKIFGSHTTLTLASPTFTNPMTALGDIIVGDAGGAPAKLAGNTTVTQMVLAQTGDGVNSALPGWIPVPGGTSGNNIMALVRRSLAQVGSGSGVLSTTSGSGSQATASVTTASLANNATENDPITLKNFCNVLYVTTNALAWVRLYTTAAARTADASRAISVDPSAGKGIFFDVEVNGTLGLAPIGEFVCGDSTSGTTGYLAITNLSGSSAAITVTLTYE